MAHRIRPAAVPQFPDCSGQSPPPNEPAAQPRGLYIPAAALGLIGTPLDRGKKRRAANVKDRFSRTHAHFLAYVDLMVNWRGQGCWASNAYLAKMVGCSKERVRQLIRDCLKLGVLFDLGEQPVECNGRTLIRRVLETSWSRAIPHELVTGYQPPLVTSYHQMDEVEREEGVAGFAGRNPTPPVCADPCSGKHARPRGNNPAEPDGDITPGNEEMDRLTAPKQSPRDKPVCAITPADRSAAATLRAFVAERGWVPVPNRRKWAEAIAILRRKLAVPADLERRLEWYCANYGKVKLPKVCCGQEFAARYEWICDRMDKKGSADLSKIVVSPEAKKIVSRLMAHNWPKGSEAQLPAVVQASLDNCETYLKQLRRVEKDLRPARQETRSRRLLRLIEAVDLEPKHHLGNWFDRVWHSIKNWDDWNGDLARYIFRTDHDWFIAECRGCAEKGGYGLELWDELSELLAKGDQQ